MTKFMQFTPYGQAPLMRDEAPRALAERLTYLEGIRQATVRDTLRHILSLATQLRLDFYVLQTSNAELAKAMEVTPRTVQNRLKEITELNLTHLQIAHDEHGQIIEFDLARYYKGGAVGGEVPHEIGGEIKNDGGVKYPTKYPTKSETGTDVATCTGVTIPPSDTTYPSEDESSAQASEPACEDKNLHQWLRTQIKSAGWVPPSDFCLDVIIQNLVTALDQEDHRKAFVSEKLAELSTRDQRPGARLMEKALREDCHAWTAPADRPQHVQVNASQTKTSSTNRPSNSFTSEGHEERFAKAVAYGTRNVGKIKTDMTAHKARQAQAELDAMWGSLIDIGAAERGEPIDEAKLREYGIHPDQRDWGVLG